MTTLHITAQENDPDWVIGKFRMISRETYQPNYCLDCNLNFFGWTCPYCNGLNVDIKQT